MNDTDATTHTAENDAPLRRRAEEEARTCSQQGCPGDGRYQPPGRRHFLNCQHDAVKWVWECVIPPGKTDG